MSQFFPSYAVFLWGNIFSQIQTECDKDGPTYLNNVQRGHYLGILNEDTQFYSFMFMYKNRINQFFYLAFFLGSNERQISDSSKSET